MKTPICNDFRSKVVKFLTEEIIQKTNCQNPNRELVLSIWKKAGLSNMFRSTIDKKYTGYENRAYSIIILEELGKHMLPDYPFWLQADVISHLVNRYGTSSQKNSLLYAICSGEKIGALALTEKEGGSNFNQFQCSVVKDGSDYVLNGQKCFVSNSTIADFYLVAAKYSNNGDSCLSLFVVDRNQEGVTTKKINNDVAMKWLDFGEITFDHVQLNEENILGFKPVDARLGLISALTIERFAISIINYHIYDILLEDISSWVQSRFVEGGVLAEQQYIKYQLGNYYADFRLMKQFIEGLKEKYVCEQKLSLTDVAIAKYKMINQLISISDFAIKLSGARAFSSQMTNLDLLKIHNDALAQSIAGGTSEIMLKIISDSFLKERKRL